VFEAGELKERLSAIEKACWKSQERELVIWKNARFAEEDLLPQVAKFLNPPQGAPTTARMWHLDGNALSSPRGLGGSAQWNLVSPQGEVPFKLESAQLVLFRTGTGFLTIQAGPCREDVSSWFDFIHYFRYIRTHRGVSVQARRRVGKDEVVPFFPEHAGGIASHPEGKGTLEDLLAALLCAGHKESEVWWREIFIPGQMLPFAALFVEGTPETESGSLLFRMRNFFHSREELNTSEEELLLNHPSLLPYTGGQWFAFSLDGAAFLALNPPETQFFSQTLSSRLRDQYFLLFLLALHQRFVLMALSQEVAEHWLSDEDPSAFERREAAFERILNTLLSFMARGHFSQVMQREHHHRCYLKYCEVFQIDRLYAEVSDEIRELHNHLRIWRDRHMREMAHAQKRHLEEKAREEERREKAAQERSQRLEGKLNFFAWLLGIPAISLAYLDAVGPVSHKVAGTVGICGLLTGALIFLGLNYYFGMRKSSEK
jgi:hypothetical protein